MRNIEALRNYFLGKDPQLEVTLADNSLRLSGIEGKHYILRGELIKRLADLKTAMEDADETLQGNIDAEALTRGQADNTLQGNIDAEALARQNADNALESKMPFKKLTADITIPEDSELNPLLLSTGWWYTGEHVIYYGEHVDPTIHNNALFYFNAEAGDQWFYFLPPNLEDGWNQLGTYLWFDSTDHIWQYSGYGVTYTVNNQSTDMQIPTAATVHDFVINNLPTNFTGTDGVNAGAKGLVPAPATTDDGKFLCADGTWKSNGLNTTDIHSDTNNSLMAKDGAVYAVPYATPSSVGQDPVPNGIYRAKALISYHNGQYVLANNFTDHYCLATDGIIIPLTSSFRGYVTDDDIVIS